MLYAVVDIETTGGYAAAHGITEIAIIIHDGNQVIETFETLINPHQSIPIHIQALTGIDNEMVANAPDFSQVASKIYDLLHNKVFVAHNVNFDFSFVRHHLQACNYVLNCKKLCTVRLSRKIIPGHRSYSLGRLCHTLGIELNNRHRAGGDAAATAILLALLIEKDENQFIQETLKKTSKEQLLPANLPKGEIEKIPDAPGVYYFKDLKGKVIYVGKAKNLKKRVITHFSGNSISAQRQNFIKDIHQIDFEVCGTELMALILEAAEIKRLWPENNRAMKRFEQKYSLYQFEDQNGYIRLGIDKHRKNGNIIYSFNYLLDGHQLLRTLITDHFLCEKMCFVQRHEGACSGHGEGNCQGACVGAETAEDYNYRVRQAITGLQNMLPSFALIDKGRTEDENSCLWIEKGKFHGMGYLSTYCDLNDWETMKSALTPYPSNNYVLNMIIAYGQQFPNKVISLTQLQHTVNY